jgi:hypothetical protein
MILATGSVGFIGANSVPDRRAGASEPVGNPGRPAGSGNAAYPAAQRRRAYRHGPHSPLAARERRAGPVTRTGLGASPHQIFKDEEFR